MRGLNATNSTNVDVGSLFVPTRVQTGKKPSQPPPASAAALGSGVFQHAAAAASIGLRQPVGLQDDLGMSGLLLPPQHKPVYTGKQFNHGGYRRQSTCTVVAAVSGVAKCQGCFFTDVHAFLLLQRKGMFRNTQPPNSCTSQQHQSTTHTHTYMACIVCC